MKNIWWSLKGNFFEVSGEDVYTLKFEAGVHRVQRVPQTEKDVFTSADCYGASGSRGI
jgi:protein subunit release factor A